ncbi:MAG: DNA repair protein RadA, partial [Sphingomonadaceae bacterium]
EIRPVAHAGLRLKEAAKLGFEKAMVPAGGMPESAGISTQSFRTLGQFVDHLLGRG